MWVRLATLDLQLPPLCWKFAPFAAITNSLTPICGGVAVLQYHIFYNVLTNEIKAQDYLDIFQVPKPATFWSLQ